MAVTRQTLGLEDDASNIWKAGRDERGGARFAPVWSMRGARKKTPTAFAAGATRYSRLGGRSLGGGVSAWTYRLRREAAERFGSLGHPGADRRGNVLGSRNVDLVQLRGLAHPALKRGLREGGLALKELGHGLGGREILRGGDAVLERLLRVGADFRADALGSLGGN